MTDDVAPGLVIHVSSGDVDLWRTALRYAHNFVTASSGERQVDIGVNGAALDLALTGSPVLALLQDVLDCGAVELTACANTMAARGIGTGNLHSATATSPAGLSLARTHRDVCINWHSRVVGGATGGRLLN